MGKNTTRTQIVDVADRLFYEHGYEHTSFADIAAEVSISRGNFYHHFKTKDQILAAVIDLRLDRTCEMLKGWERAGATPRQRIESYIRILLTNWEKIRDHGCPVGSLCTELARLGHASREEANGLFTMFRVWLREQFRELGRTRDADDLAMQVLAWSQGVAVMASTFHDEKFTRREVRRMCDWLKTVSGERKQ